MKHLKTLIGIAVLVALFYLSNPIMAESRVVEIILSGGEPDFIDRLLAISFVLLRVFVLFVLPGFMVNWLVELWTETRSEISQGQFKT